METIIGNDNNFAMSNVAFDGDSNALLSTLGFTVVEPEMAAVAA